MSTLSTTAVANGGKAVALSVVFGMVLAFVPFLSVVAVPAMPIPVAYITARHGMLAGLLASAATGALCTVLTGFFTGLLVFLLVAVVGAGIGLGLRAGLSQIWLFVSAAALFLVSMALWLGIVLLSAGMGPAAAIASVTDQALVPARDIYTALGMGEDRADEAVGQAREFASMLPYLMPAALLVLSLTLSGATIALARQIFNRLRQPFPRDFSFRHLRLHFTFAYVMIVGLLCELSVPYVPEAFASTASLVGMNLLIVSEALFFIQGMAIAYYFLCLYKVSRPRRIGVYICLILLQITLSLTSWLGLFDTWIDYRRRFGKKRSQGQPG